MFASILKELRKSQKYTQDQIADALSVPVRTYGSWERGERQPDIETLIKIADFYQVTADYLLGRTPMSVTVTHGDPPPPEDDQLEMVFQPDDLPKDPDDLEQRMRAIVLEELKKRGL